jgi:glycosyltransferase involved in cell wall biosynthesis
MKVVVRGPVLSKSGYGEHARQVFQWAMSRGHDVRCHVLNWGITPWFLDRNDLDGMVGDIMDRSAPFNEKADLSLQVQLPNEWDPSIANINVGITAGVESDRCSEAWKEACNGMSHVIFPSSFSRSAFLVGNQVKVGMSVVPEAYNRLIDKNVDALELSEVNTKFNFLLFGQVTSGDFDSDRKNLFNTVKWFCEEFEGNKDVGLIVKSNMGTNCVFHKQNLKTMFSNLVNTVRKSQYPKVYLLNGDMSDREVAGLLKSPKVNVMLSLTRGEGYGLPLVDAAASDLPIIATNWSGHLEFLSKGHFNKVEYDLVEVPKSRIDGSIFIEGSRWAMPREQDAKKRMSKIIDSYSRPKEWAVELGQKVRKDFCLESIFDQYDRVIGSLL